MAKNLTKQKWLKVFKLVDKKIRKCVELYNKFNPSKYKARDWKCK